MTEFEKLDMVLSYLRSDEDFESFTDIKEHFPSITVKELALILEKLIKDGYVDFEYHRERRIDKIVIVKNKTKRDYHISYDGIFFEGYRQKKEDIERQRLRDNLNIWAVTLGGVGALIAGLYYLGLIAIKVFSLFFCQ